MDARGAKSEVRLALLLPFTWRHCPFVRTATMRTLILSKLGAIYGSNVNTQEIAKSEDNARELEARASVLAS